MDSFTNKVFLEKDERAFLPRVRVVRPQPRLKNYTKQLMTLLTPKIPKSEFEGGIKVKCGTVIARPDYGKTELLKIICKELFKHYGEENVNALMGMELDSLIANFDDKPVQVLIVEDSTSLKKKKQEDIIKHYVRIRHKLKDVRDRLEQVRSGIIIVIFSSHSFYMLDKKVRTLFNFIIMKSTDSNDYNKRTIIQEFGFHGLKKLEEISYIYEMKDDSSVLCDSVCSIIGLPTGGYIHFDYDPKEAAIIPWREIEEEEPSPITIISSKRVKEYDFPTNWGSFGAILHEKMLGSDPNVRRSFKMKTDESTSICTNIWYGNYFAKLSLEELEETFDLETSSLSNYYSRVNEFMKTSEGDKVKKEVSEQWVLDELNKIFPLSPDGLVARGQCDLHKSPQSDQHSDVCIHDRRGDHLLSLNVKWHHNKAESKKVEASPEYRTPPHAVLFIGTRTGKKGGTKIRFEILPKETKEIRIKDLQEITEREEKEREEEEEERGKTSGRKELEGRKKKDRGNILLEVAEIITSLYEKKAVKKSKRKAKS